MKTTGVRTWRVGKRAIVTTDEGERVLVAVHRGQRKPGKVFGNRVYHWMADVIGDGWSWRGGAFKSDSFQAIARRAMHGRRKVLESAYRDQAEAFHEGTIRAAAEAEDAWRSVTDADRYAGRAVVLAEAIRLARAEFVARVEAYGERCEACDGQGDVVTGELAESRLSPAEDVYSECSKCGGRGKTLPTSRSRS